MLDHEVSLSQEPLTCPRCGAQFTCGLALGEARCWCFDLPAQVHLSKKGMKEGCLCPKCLQAVLDEIIAEHGEQKLNVKHDPQITLK
ncbi:MAG: cysteine-rich CWC family protein [Anaerolineaceae bacterium]|nr:cysteine-rich CWC family protein [Anaerolineaceae bacterium]